MNTYTYHCDNCGRGTLATHEILYTDPDAAASEITRDDQPASIGSSIVCAACVKDEYEYIADSIDPHARLAALNPPRNRRTCEYCRGGKEATHELVYNNYDLTSALVCDQCLQDELDNIANGDAPEAEVHPM